MYVDNDRWRGVPFYLRTGKALAESRRTITLRFRTPRLVGDAARPNREPARNELVLELTDEPHDLASTMRAKRPGPDMELVEATFRLDFA